MEASQQVCERCGERLGGGRFCGNCGRELAPGESPTASDGARPNGIGSNARRRHYPSPWLFGPLALAAVVIGIVVVSGDKQSADEHASCDSQSEIAQEFFNGSRSPDCIPAPGASTSTVALASSVMGEYQAYLVDSAASAPSGAATGDVIVEGVTCTSGAQDYRCAIRFTVSDSVGSSGPMKLVYPVVIQDGGCWSAGRADAYARATDFSGCITDSDETGDQTSIGPIGPG